jgi:hypothetical protein
MRLCLALVPPRIRTLPRPKYGLGNPRKRRRTGFARFLDLGMTIRARKEYLTTRLSTSGWLLQKVVVCLEVRSCAWTLVTGAPHDTASATVCDVQIKD